MVSDNDSFIAIDAVNDDVISVATSSGSSEIPPPPSLLSDGREVSCALEDSRASEAVDTKKQIPRTRSVVSEPGRLNGTEPMDDDMHQFPSAASATDPKGFPAPPIESIEVDTLQGTVKLEGEENHCDHCSTDGSSSSLSQLSQYHQCWLVVFFRKCARKTRSKSRAVVKKCKSKVKKAVKSSSDAIKKYSPRAKEVMCKSLTNIQDASFRSVAFVKGKSVEYKSRAIEFNEKHQVKDKAKTSLKQAGKSMKKISKVAVERVRQVSTKTAQNVAHFEAKHQVVAKSKYGLTESRRLIKNAWNGKPLRTGARPFAADIEDVASENPETLNVDAEAIEELEEKEELAQIPATSE